MINQFARWWGGQLLTLLPDTMRGRDLDEGRGILITLVSSPGTLPEAIDVRLPSAQQAERLLLDEDGLARLRGLRARAPRAAVRLRLRPGSLLERDVALPLAAETALDRVLQYEMDRLTPFSAAETFWSWVVTRRERARGRILLRLTLGPRAPIAPMLAKLAAAGAGPAVLEAAAHPGRAPAEGAGWRRINLAHQGRGRARTAPLLRLGLTACAVLLVALVAVPFLRQSLELARLDARIAALSPRVVEAAQLRRAIEQKAAGGSVVVAARQQVGDPLHALAAVTDALPDDTWLTDLVLEQRRLRIDGESRMAVRLIARLTASPAIVDPAFAAPVTRDDSGHADVFSISATLVP